MDYISESDYQQAARVLAEKLSNNYVLDFIGGDESRRLSQLVGPLNHGARVNLMVRQHGAQLLSAALDGNATASVRRKLLNGLSDAELGHLYGLAYPYNRVPAVRGTRVQSLSHFHWHRGSESALCFTRAFGLPDSFSGVKSRLDRDDQYEISSYERLPPLKPFQKGIVVALKTLSGRVVRAMVSSFTGTGKTRIGMEFATDELLNHDEADPGCVLWIAQKRELLDQACDALEPVWAWRSEQTGDPLLVYRYLETNRFRDVVEDRHVFVVATAQQVIARLYTDDFLRRILESTRLLVIDEAHHSLARGHQQIIEAYVAARRDKPQKIIGLTATPGRSNLMDDTESRQLAALFTQQIIVPATPEGVGSLEWFQQMGYLARIRHRKIPTKSHFTVASGTDVVEPQPGHRDYTDKFLRNVGDDDARNREIVKVLRSLPEQGRQSLVFCCNVSHAEIIWRALAVSGCPAEMIHYKVDRRDRRSAILRFRRGEIRTLINVEVLTTGFDAPKVDTVVLCRPTLSRILYEQMVGRGLRGPEMGGTETCEIIDFVDNFSSFGLVQGWEAFWKEWDLAKPTSIAGQYANQWTVTRAQPVEEVD